VHYALEGDDEHGEELHGDERADRLDEI
jgi:hypothetical protein